MYDGTGKNHPWHASGFSSAAGVIVEHNPDVTARGFGGRFRLRGFSVSGSTAVAISTENITLLYGDSSDATLTEIPLCKEPGTGMLGATEMMGLYAGYFALTSTVVHANGGLVAMLWGN